MLSRSLTSRTWTKLPDDRCRFAPIHLCISAEFPRNIKDFRPTTIRPVTESHRLVNLLTQVPKAASGRRSCSMRVRPNPLATEPLLDQPLRSSAGGVGAGLSGSPHYKVLGDGALLGRARRP